MYRKAKALAADPTRLLKVILVAGAVAIAAFALTPRAQAAAGLCAAGGDCGRDLAHPLQDQHVRRYQTALQQTAGPEGSPRRAELSDKDYSTFSGIGVISCTVQGETRSSTAFLVGAFDIGVTVAHTFGPTGPDAPPPECVYNSVDSLGQVRERIPVAYVRSQWQAEADAFGQPAKDFAVVRLSTPSRYAQRTMPLGRFSGAATPAVMVGFQADLDADTVKHKSRGTVYGQRENVETKDVTEDFAGFMHDMYSRGIASGAPVFDERSGVVIGIHTRLRAQRNTMIAMNDWLEATLRSEMRAETKATAH
jgi:Trypsin-like peptidase domain